MFELGDEGSRAVGRYLTPFAYLSILFGLLILMRHYDIEYLFRLVAKLIFLMAYMPLGMKLTIISMENILVIKSFLGFGNKSALGKS